jgi:hypothetical protein
MTPDNAMNLAFGLSAAFFAMIGIWQAYRLSTLSAGQSMADIKYVRSTTLLTGSIEPNDIAVEMQRPRATDTAANN